MLAELIRNRELVYTLVKRDLKVRYKASTLGFLWSFGRPLFLMIIMWGVFSHIVGVTTDIPYALHLLTGILPWMFFQGGLAEAQASILANSNVVKKVYLPTAAFPTATVLSHLVHFFLALMILSLFIAAYAVPTDLKTVPGWEIIFLPLIILLQTIIILGIAYIISALNVFYRDVGSITEILLTGWFYLTPIIYPVQEARNQLKGMNDSDWLYYLYLCNPMTPIVVAYRRVMYGRYLRSAPEVSDFTLLVGLGISTVFAVAVFFFGAWLFARKSPKFADEL